MLPNKLKAPSLKPIKVRLILSQVTSIKQLTVKFTTTKVRTTYILKSN